MSHCSEENGVCCQESPQPLSARGPGAGGASASQPLLPAQAATLSTSSFTPRWDLLAEQPLWRPLLGDEGRRGPQFSESSNLVERLRGQSPVRAQPPSEVTRAVSDEEAWPKFRSAMEPAGDRSAITIADAVQALLNASKAQAGSMPGCVTPPTPSSPRVPRSPRHVELSAVSRLTSWESLWSPQISLSQLVAPVSRRLVRVLPTACALGAASCLLVLALFAGLLRKNKNNNKNKNQNNKNKNNKNNKNTRDATKCFGVFRAFSEP
ncbi:unnamed protein product [Polarella glacialis]|uniref:Transmembrane protein n=1 Tax=Polarella glacialis TaxID=89957 RepID=A0A813LRP9_POLGL|nr:unnamed protein product [Polarella glacialis]